MTAVSKAAEQKVDEIIQSVRRSINDQEMTLDEAAFYCDMSADTLKKCLRGKHRPNSVNLFKMVVGIGVAL